MTLRLTIEYDGTAFRGWDFYVNAGYPATHIVHKWPDDAVKVTGKKALEVGKWHYVTISYDGGGSAKGVKIYLDGALQEVNVETDTLKNSIRTEVPLKLTQRNTTARLDDLALQDLRIYRRVLAPEEVTSLASLSRTACPE